MSLLAYIGEPSAPCMNCDNCLTPPAVWDATEAGRKLLSDAVDALKLSARAYHRVLKLSRTIADLAGEKHILPAHLAEALQYRPREIG